MTVAVILLDSSFSFLSLKNNIQNKFTSINSIIEPNKSLGFSLTPSTTGRVGCHHNNNIVNISKDGFRLTRPGHQKKLRIHIFGDSFTFGNGVRDNETFPYFLSTKIDKYQVINYGVPGWGITQMYQSFLDNKSNINPGDIVIFSPIYEDFTRDLNSPYFISFMYLFSGLDLKKFPKLKHSKMEYIHIDNPSFYLRAHLFNSKLFGGIAQKFIQNKTKSFRDSEEITTLVSQAVKDKKAHFLMTVLPDSYSDTQEALAQEKWLSKFKFFTSITEKFYSQNDLKSLFRTNCDSHYTAKGNQLVANLIHEAIISVMPPFSQ